MAKKVYVLGKPLPPADAQAYFAGSPVLSADTGVSREAEETQKPVRLTESEEDRKTSGGPSAEW